MLWRGTWVWTCTVCSSLGRRVPDSLPGSPGPWGKAEGGVLGSGAPAASSAGCAWDTLMHTCSASASSDTWRARRLLGFCGSALSPELWGGSLPPAGMQPLAPTQPSCLQAEGADVALSTLLVEAGPVCTASGGSCSQKMAQPLTMAWQGLEGADRWGLRVGSLYKIQASSPLGVYLL